ncbi:MAG: hypothetical protein ACM3TN_17540 [Alphaproteobacteria bacterium]
MFHWIFALPGSAYFTHPWKKLREGTVGDEDEFPAGVAPRKQETKVITESPVGQFWGGFGRRF